MAAPPRQGTGQTQRSTPSRRSTRPLNFWNHSLPSVIESARDGWQMTSQSGAVVSGLLAAVAAQLLGYFRDGLTAEGVHPSPGGRWVVIAFCYAAIFLNINATIGSFVLIDGLGELGYKAAKSQNARTLTELPIGNDHSSVNDVFQDLGMTLLWPWMLLHWLATFYLGIITLIISVLTYVVVVEETSMKVVMCVLVGLTLIPTTSFIILGGFFRKGDGGQGGTEVESTHQTVFLSPVA